MLLTCTSPGGPKLSVKLKPISSVHPVKIGRGADADVTLADSKCSRIHAAIRYWDDIFVVRDMGSRNGTYVNGTRVDVARLCPGDVVTIGNCELRASEEVSRNAGTVMQ